MSNSVMTVLSEQAPAASCPSHKLKLVVATGGGGEFTCKGCKEVGAGDRYRCRSQPCDFDLHKDCALAEDTLVHPLFENYKFELRRGPGKNERLLCDACGTRVHGWHYHCDRKDLDLHPCCAKLPMEIQKGELTFELRKEATHRCNICRRSGGYGTFWFYRSTCKTVYLHVRCVKKQLVTCSPDPAAGGSASTPTTPADNTTTMASFVQAALQGYSGNKYDLTRDIVTAIVRAIVGIIRGDPREIITAAADLIYTCSTGR